MLKGMRKFTQFIATRTSRKFHPSSTAGELNTVKFSGPVLVQWQSDDGSEDREIHDVQTIKSFDGLVYKDASTGEPEDLSAHTSKMVKTVNIYTIKAFEVAL